MTAPIKPTIPFSDLEKIDVRVGTIEAIEDVEKSDKLVRMIVDFGDHKRKILVGMKKERPNVSPEDPPLRRIRDELLGRQALFVVNLEPRKIMGELSEGMIFDIGYADGLLPVLAVPEKPVPAGTRVG
ncbi:MAG: tRNA-binding protein [archaeon]